MDDTPTDLRADGPGALYLTTKEVAELLRVKERKVYDLAAAGDIPFRRITGKLLFPRAELFAWIEGSEPGGGERPSVLTGSHDPLLDWAARESGAGLATLWNGSLDGLERFAEGAAAAAGLHVPDEEGWNVRTVAARGLRGAVLVGWARRSRGLILSPALEGAVATLSDLKGKRVARRQPGAGAAALFDRLCAEAGMSASDIEAPAALARTESDAAASVAAGEADAALGLEAMARRFQLPFAPLLEERFDLIVDRRSYFTEPFQALLSFARGAACQAKAEAMGGYALDALGVVRWVSP